MKIEQKATLRVVENKEVTCNTCLFSEPFKHASLGGQYTLDDATVMCRAKGEQRDRTFFCPEGLWLYNGEVLEFKAAFKKVYDTENNPKDLTRRNDEG
jgi:hypothetical protein